MEARFGHEHTRFVEAQGRAAQLDLDFMVVSVMRCSIRLALCMGVVAGVRGWCDDVWPPAATGSGAPDPGPPRGANDGGGGDLLVDELERILIG
jgi:hypothetical protein